MKQRWSAAHAVRPTALIFPYELLVCSKDRNASIRLCCLQRKASQRGARSVATMAMQTIASLPAAKHDAGPLSRSAAILEAFQIIDKNADGSLSRAEIIKACRSSHKIRSLLGLPSVIRQEDGSRDVFEEVFQQFDSDGSKSIDLSEFQKFFYRLPVWPKRQAVHSPSTALQRADAILKDFNMDECPTFSRTVLTASPLLQYLHLESGEARPLPNPALGLLRLSPSKAQIRRTSFSSENTELELPKALQPLLQQHKRAVWTLFSRWERSGHKTIPVLGFAEGVQEITGVGLSDEDLLQTIMSIEPVSREDLLADASWRSHRLDCARLYRKLQSSQKRLASQYIAQSVAGAEQPYVPVRRTSITGAHHIQHRTTGDELPVRHAVATTVQGQVQSSSSPPKPSSASILDQRTRGPGFLTGKSSANVLGHA